MAVLQMTWQPSSLCQKRKSGPPLGLKNLGNTCYLNSVLQCLTYTPPLANFCLKSQHSSSCDIGGAAASEKKRECPFCILERRIARSLSLESNLDAPVKINSCLKIFAEHFRHGRQEDAHEFLRYVIDACHNTCLRLKKLQLQRRKFGESGNDGTIVKEIFGGALQSQVKCLSCGTESNKVDEIMDISLDVLHCGSLKDALQRFFQHEILDGNNKYKCDNCKKLVAARKQMSILQAPNVLVIQLKRFEGILGGKIDRAIAFEEILVLSSYMCKGSQDLYPEYRLCGTIVHSGFSPDSGHYFAYIKDAVGRWYCCNDSYVTLSTLEDVLSEKVYILFFTRSKQRPSLIKTGLLANGSKCHQSNGSNASKILNSGQPEKVVNSTKQLPDRQFEINSSVISKVEMVSSDPPRKLSINESSVSRKYHANGGIKIIINRKESVEKTCNRTDSVDTDSKQHNEQILRNGNNISNVRPDDSFDAVKSKPLVTIANGNCRIQNVKDHFVEGGHHGDGVREANVASNPAVSNDAENKQNNLQILSNRNGFSDVKPDDTFDDVKNKLPFTIANGNCKIWNFNGYSLNGDHHGDSVSKGNMEIEKPPNCTKLSNGDVKSHSDKLGLKRKLQDRDPCILLAKDAQSHVKVEDFKEVIGKEAKLFLETCGWSDEVHHFMHSRKRLRLGGAENDASNINERKRLLIKDAKPTFISKIPELLKGKLVDRLFLFSKEK